ncbi:amidohydrolase family protein [Actinomadura madurae]|uniref:metal-dependent hydrolase family protein n=1 Tax=Actinomadura madurae TaxID=1993 RepID=UPI0020268E1C|nr:amidohydrolase family protein [Actinomadura madurae]URN00786.1 amidohydrolase family protein [Actinomadura madurae]
MSTRQRIEADLLIPGRGGPVRDGVVVIDGAAIAYAGPRAGAPIDGPPVEPVHARTVMPGMWDCHTHVKGGRPGAFDDVRLVQEHPATRAARGVQGLRRALDAGVTSIREVGGMGLHLAPVVAEGYLPGPTIHAAGAVLSATGGHGDIHGLPAEWVHDCARMGTEFQLADGEAECAKAVRAQIRRNARVIKVCASGGVLSVIDDPDHQEFTVRELRTIVEVAGLAERGVAAHCHGKAGIMAALEAGVLTIEHGSHLDDEACTAMREAGAILVPTLTIVRELLDAGGLPPYAARKLAGIARVHRDNIARAHQAGVRIAMGTDIQSSGDAPAAWGRHGREAVLLNDIGMNPLDVIEAATANGPATLGRQAPRSGLLQEGFDADVLAIDGDPLSDISLLSDPSRITAVWQAGTQVKG